MIKKTPRLMASLTKICGEIASRKDKTVCFTSSTAREGTTTIAFAIAEAAVSQQRKVLYCDFCDYSTSLSKHLKISFHSSEKDYLQQVYENINFITPSGFYLIPPLISLNPDLNQKVFLTDLFDKFKNDYDLIIIDSNYYDSFNEGVLSTNSLTHAADSTVLVALTGGISETRVKQTVDKIVRDGGKLIGIVLNDVNYPMLVDELCDKTHSLDNIFPKTAEDLRQWLHKSDFFNTEI